MKFVLFLGNSHLSSVKIAYDDEYKGRITPVCKFFCARGADLNFTDVRDGRIVPNPKAAPCAEDLYRFFPDRGRNFIMQYYVQTNRPIADVAQQFLNTGGSQDIDLQGVDAIFYLAGVSPYDFLRLKERIAPVSRSLRRELLGGMLGERFLLREHIGKIRAYRPACKHYFIGSPLMAASYTALSRDSRCIVAANRSIINSMAQDYLFDAIFMPDAELLTESLLATREAYCARGREESERFQRQAVTKSDLSHMNGSYGKKIFAKFIEPLISRSAG
jgi:hypothetical protein